MGRGQNRIRTCHLARRSFRQLFRVADFPLRTYKLGVSDRIWLSRFGSVSVVAYVQALAGLSWLSSSPLGFPRRRSWLAPMRCVTAPQVPTHAALHRPPPVDTGPADGIWLVASPALSMTALLRRRQGLSESPAFLREASDRTQGLLFTTSCGSDTNGARDRKGLLLRASVELRKRLATYVALRARPHVSQRRLTPSHRW